MGILNSQKKYFHSLKNNHFFVRTGQPKNCFTKNDEGKNVMLIGGIYYKQTSNFGAMLKRVVLIVALILALSTVILGIISLIGLIIGKLTWRELIPRVIPMIGVGLLVWAVLNLLEVQNYTYKLAELNTINSRTMIIFFRNFCFLYYVDRKFIFFDQDI